MKKLLVAFLFSSFALTNLSYAGSLEQAKRIHDRIAGVPANDAQLNDMSTLIDAGNPIDAAYLAIDHPAFYNVTLKSLVTPWTNEAQTSFAPLNDYTATVIGTVRDNLDFRTLLYDNILYIGAPSLGLTNSYSVTDNDHYEEMELEGVDLKTGLQRVNQSTYSGIPASATAGVITSRASAQAFFIDGTNRAMLRFTVLNHLCHDLEQIKDNTRATDRIRQDVSRSPGGDSRLYINACSGCHAGMDPLTQAFAYYNYRYNSVNDPQALNGQIEYTPDVVQPKNLINASNFPHGYITTDDRWDNYWRYGPNALLGWDTSRASGGYGAKSLGEELAHSEAFASCQVKKVFKKVCLRDPENSMDHNKISEITASFKADNYNLKRVFAESAVYCMGD